mgnify:CR=1 FL=1
MNKIKYEIPGVIFTLSLLISSIGIEEKTIRYILILITLLCNVFLVYIITKEISDYIGSCKKNEDNELKEICNELKISIEKYSEEQFKNANQLTIIIKEFINASNSYIEEIKNLVNIENSIVDEEKILSNEIQSINENIYNTLNNFSVDFLENQKQSNKEELNALDNMADRIDGYMKKYEEDLNSVNIAMKSLRTEVKINLDKVNTAINDQTTSIEDGFEDFIYEFNGKINDFSKNQKHRDEEQNDKLNNEINSIQDILSQQIGKTLDANEKLLSYIQKVQEEWTTLSKDEIAFLDKVWNE